MPRNTASRLAHRFAAKFTLIAVSTLFAAAGFVAPTMQAQTQVDAPNDADTTSHAASAAQIRGQLTDPQGLGIIGVTVTLRSTLSGASRTAKTGANGAF